MCRYKFLYSESLGRQLAFLRRAITFFAVAARDRPFACASEKMGDWVGNAAWEKEERQASRA